MSSKNSLLVETLRSRKLMKIEETFSFAPENCGTLEEAVSPLPPSVVETMKMVFRETHGGEMTPEDREFLGIADQ